MTDVIEHGDPDQRRRRVPARWLGLGLVGVAIAAGLGLGVWKIGLDSGSRSPSGAPVGAASVITAAPSPSPKLPGFEVSCQAVVHGSVGRLSHVDVVAGPIAFINLGAYTTLPADRLTSNRGGYRGLPVLVDLHAGWQATVSVARSERSLAALLYDPDLFAANDSNAFSTGEPVVSFPSCLSGPIRSGNSGWDTGEMFRGGVLARKPLCLRLQILTQRDHHILVEPVAAAVGQTATCR
jgi:hypothetical protein